MQAQYCRCIAKLVLLTVASFAGLTLDCSTAFSQSLVQVDGVTPQCVVNAPRQVQHPGSGTRFSAPQYGYCSGTIQHNCATANQPYGASSSAYETIPVACEGTFTSWADIQAQQASSIASLQALIQQQLNLLKANIKVLSDSNDALAKRLTDLESKINALSHPK